MTMPDRNRLTWTADPEPIIGTDTLVQVDPRYVIDPRHLIVNPDMRSNP